MTSTPKPASRWGSFLQQAVAGVESRLDTILAEDDGKSASSIGEKDSVREQPAKKDQMVIPSSARSSGELSRQSSTSKRNDRLQERLAKAVVNRNIATVPSTSVELKPEATNPVDATGSARASSEIKLAEIASNLDGGDNGVEYPQRHSTDVSQSESVEPAVDPAFALSEESSEPRNSEDVYNQEKKAFLAPAPTAVRTENIISHGNTLGTLADYEDLFQRMRSDNETAELRRQEETHQYLERIDALQAKLQYYVKEALESAKHAAEESKTGSAEHKLAQKDEKIALLMDEGQKLSQNELRHLTTIKKLRAKSVDDEKRLTQIERDHCQAGKVTATLNEKLKLLETAQLDDRENQKRIEKELERSKAESASKSSKLAEMKFQLEKAQALAPAQDLAKYKNLLDIESRTTVNLREEISTLQIEKKLAEDRHRSQLLELQGKFNREKERSRITESELQGEIGVLESRLETYRARAEEVSSGSNGDTQAKLYRQIETLQSQYSVASENWRGIESSLLARIATLEKDRDDLNKKETELRRKAREAAHKCRRAEEELEQAANKYDELNMELTNEVAKSAPIRENLVKLQTDLAAAQMELESLKKELRTLHLDAEKREQAVLEIPFARPRTPSPLPLGSKSAADRIYYDKSSHLGRRQQGGSGLGLSGIFSSTERPVSRKASGQIGQMPFPTNRQDSMVSMSQSSTRGSVHSIPQTPYSQTEPPDEFFDGVMTSATPERTINDMFSASTAAAGPSIQLVERMSAAIRRLESEKAASKDELERISAQRDETREQVVTLMREVEEKREVDKRTATLEAKVATLDKRYQTTLEMLGEKSERVEELQADIADMKQIYKDALEKSIQL